MKSTNHYLTKLALAVLLICFLLGLQLQLNAQSITVYQYRQVPPDKMEEFIKRETTYWSKVAEAAIAKGNLEFWGLFQKVGGFDMPNSSNILFINTFKDIDATQGTWDASAVFPDVPMDQMETFSMGKVMHSLYLRPESFIRASTAVPEDDFKYVTMVYHDTSFPDSLIALENKHWGPFIKAAMDGGKTTQKAWGNATILSPSGPNMKATTVSFDIYPSLKEALNTTLAEDIVFPWEGLAEIGAIETGQRTSYIYRRVMVVTPPEEGE